MLEDSEDEDNEDSEESDDEDDMERNDDFFDNDNNIGKFSNYGFDETYDGLSLHFHVPSEHSVGIHIYYIKINKYLILKYIWFSKTIYLYQK